MLLFECCFMFIQSLLNVAECCLKSFNVDAVKTEKILSDGVNAIMSLACKKRKKKSKKKNSADSSG